MKFPTTERLVPEFPLSDAGRENFSNMARALVDITVSEYLEYDRLYQCHVSPEEWKAVKRRESLTVYKGRKISRPSAMDAPQRDWKVPRLLMVGSIVGTLEDVMYGAATFDAASMLLKTTYTHDGLADGEILNQIRGPTPEDPFHFLGLKWIVMGTPAAVRKLVHPRDYVFLEATGIETRWTGERYGYHLMHSVDLPGIGPLPSKSGVLRGLVSSCIVYKQRPGDASTVDVYMKAKFEPNGNVGETVAAISAANGLIYCWRSVYCAQHKKLAWLVSSQKNISTTSSSDKACSTCGKLERAYRQLTACALCRQRLCSTCRIGKKISYVASRRGKAILRQALPFCVSCVARASQTSALEIAGDEVRSGRWDANRVATGSVDGFGFAARFASLQLRSDSIDTSSTVSEGDREASSRSWARTLSYASSEDSVDSPRPLPAKARQHRQVPDSRELSGSASKREPNDKPSIDQWSWTHAANRTFHAPRITQLREAAENVYQIAMANAAVMHTAAKAAPVPTHRLLLMASDEATATQPGRLVREARMGE